MPLKNTVLFPQQVIPIYVGREKSLKLIEDLPDDNKYLVVVAQQDGSIEDPKEDDLYSYGTLALVLKTFDMPDNSKSAIVQGVDRVKILKFNQGESYFMADIERIQESITTPDVQIEALAKNLKNSFTELIKISPNLNEEHAGMLSNIDRPSRLADRATSLLSVSNSEKQQVLEELDVRKRVENAINLLQKEIQRIKLGEEIQSEVQDEISKTQREYYLREQMKTIQKELGEDSQTVELDELKKKIEDVKMSDEANKVANKELDRLGRISPQSPEYSVSRTYLEWLSELPWSKSSRDNLNVKEAQKRLDQDHYGLPKVKERVLEYLAVRSLKKKVTKEETVRGPILCFTGPPGVGKTSLGKSIAKSMGREFVRISLGGVRDEAEIRGHRRTYIGALPGRIIQSLKKAKTNNPVFMLDEIDKLGSDFRGDPSSAMLEVLDPEQNNSFQDHYLEIDYDLSKTMFITTANTLNIPDALLDRMEIIRLPGYTESEKLQIAKNHLITKLKNENKVKDDEILLSDKILKEIIQKYTKEAGVRSLEREISKLIRKIITDVEINGRVLRKIEEKNLIEYLGPPKYNRLGKENVNLVGVTNGLAWTQVGGELLNVEVVKVRGKGRFSSTGKLGDVMKESIKAAEFYIKSNHMKLGIEQNIINSFDVHVHVPEGATPKDGPSAGVAMISSIVSTLTDNKVRCDVAMTGEITLKGKVLPIGGLKEKLLAAI